jgi:hypothetical protein
VTRARAIALLVLAVGLLGAIEAVRERESDTAFIAQQHALVPIGSVALGNLLALTHDPRPGHGSGHARAAVCRAFGTGQLRNPWLCEVTYPTAPRVSYRVTVASDGAVQGENRGLKLFVRGCCVAATS